MGIIRIIKKVFLFVSLLFIFFNLVIISFSTESTLSINSPNYFNEQNNIYKDINYLKNEYLSFKFCTDIQTKNISANIICSNSKSKTLNLFNSKKKGCFFSNYDLYNLSCNDFSLKIKYNLKNKKKEITRTFKAEKQSLLINYILNQNYSNLSPVDLSYYLLILNNLENPNNKKNIQIYNKLKNERDNLKKCWPNGNCNIFETTNILKNLKLAGYSLDSRMLKDGQNYLEKNMISNSNNPLKISINVSNIYQNNSGVSCSLKLDNGNSRNYIFNSNFNYLHKYISKSIDFNCNESLDNIYFKVYDGNGKIKKSFTYTNLNSFSYNIKDFSCFGINGNCEFFPSINSLITYNSQIKNSPLIENYIDSLITKNKQDITFNTQNKIEDTGRYLYFKSNPDLLNNLKFTQNNEGSWGVGSDINKIKKTSWAILGLQARESSNEYISDGQKWIYFNEPKLGWGSIEKNSLAYLAIKENIKPYLKINSKNQIKKTINFTLKNPTIYKIRNIKVTFDSNINPFLSYVENLGELDGGSSLNFNISLNNDFFGNKEGNMLITGINGHDVKLNLIKMPIELKGPNPFDLISQNLSFKLSSENKIINLRIKKNINQFNSTCSYLNPFTNKLNTLKVNSSLNYFNIIDNQLKFGNYSFSINCKNNLNTFSFPINLNIRIIKKDFKINIPFVKIISSKDFSIKATNTITKKEVLNFKIEGNLKDVVLPAEKNKIIAVNDTREIFFTISSLNSLKKFNSSNSQIVITSDNGYIKKIPIKIDLNSIKQSSNGLPLWVYILGGLIIIFIIFIIIGRYIRSREVVPNDLVTSNQNDFDYDEEIILK